MRIGIITVFAVPNYGAMLQAYALSTFLQQEGHEAEIVDYRQPDLAKMYRFRWTFPPALNHFQRLRRCGDFVKTRIRRSRREYRSVNEFAPGAGGYDAVITGSDQVWFTGPVQHFDPMFFLDWAGGTARRISYAPSVGSTADFAPHGEKVRTALARYHRVGVRDAHTASLVAPMTQHPLTETVDPTFLHDFAELLEEKPPTDEPYLLVFGNFSGALASVVREARRATGLKKVVTLQYACPEADVRVASPSPVEWLNWFRHAAFVVTSYFHGTAFAVNFQRPFLTVPTPGRRQKVRTLLEPLGLGDRCLDGSDPASATTSLAAAPLDWARASTALQEKVAVSVQFLRESLA